MDRESYYRGKTVLVTGGVGSIGSQLVRGLIQYHPQSVRILDNNETGLFDLEQELKSDLIRPLVGDVRDLDRLRRAFEGVDLVFHAAALKHVPICEFNPFDAVKTNVLGTQNVLDAALDEEVEKVIMISTDKAVNPTNVMGATKLLAERLTISANSYRGSRRTVLSCVRFGNVLGSRGSVVPLFKKQIERGDPLTITDVEMTRFIMDIPKAVELILKAAEIATGGEIFILKMPVMKISDLTQVMIEELSPEGMKIESKNIGRRPGEKMYEELMTELEATNAYESEDMIVVLPHQRGYLDHQSQEPSMPANFRKTEMESYSSQDAALLSREEIKVMLHRLNLP
ncbi:MAG: polysaccharide biosynthesis protein [Methanotrichaceae archaeon]|nr:polysaccharide biosynthesis protein [Methanotrichaceae archaeon]